MVRVQVVAKFSSWQKLDVKMTFKIHLVVPIRACSRLWEAELRNVSVRRRLQCAVAANEKTSNGRS